MTTVCLFIVIIYSEPRQYFGNSTLVNTDLSWAYQLNIWVAVGIFHQDKEDFPAGLIVGNGILSVTQIILQLVFINIIINRVNRPEEDSHPGRQFTTFLVLLNFTLWLVNTFELQKNQASEVESALYGVYVWVWLQRLTLPLVIFFRYAHSPQVWSHSQSQLF